MSRLRVTSGAYDISEEIEGLTFSNVAPGGDESASFTLKRSWFADNPEIARGNILRIMDGVDVLWQGRVEEADRSGDSTESIAVTAYGLGARLKDTTMRRIYVDRDFGSWSGPSVQRRLNLYSSSFNPSEGGAADDTTTGAPALAQSIEGPSWGTTAKPAVENYYDAKGLIIGDLYYAWKISSSINSADANWQWQAGTSTDDILTTNEVSGNLRAAGPGTGTVTPGTPNKTWAFVQILYNAAHATAIAYEIFWTMLAVYENHGLTKRGTAGASSAQGFYASDIIPDAVGEATGIAVRQVDATTFVIVHSVYKEPTGIEDIINDANAFHAHERTWGTWGPDSPLDTSETGYFDYATIDTAPSWFVEREEADSLNLHSETATLYNQVDVTYTDSSGAQQITTRTRDVPDLNGITRKATIDAGNATLAVAQTLGDVFLALSGGFAPARGQITLSQPVRHATRGDLPAHYMRADGAAMRISDILPAATLFTLDSAPDRRTTFPIKRVSVSVGDKISTDVELDQTNDSMAAMQRRLELNSQFPGVARRFPFFASPTGGV